MSKDMEFYNYEAKINEIKCKGIKSNNAEEIQNCINELYELHKEFDYYAENDELYELYEKAIKELHEHKKLIENN